jgi:hypothetical protein
VNYTTWSDPNWTSVLMCDYALAGDVRKQNVAYVERKMSVRYRVAIMRMVYLAFMFGIRFGFEVDIRIGEYAKKENGGMDLR